MDGGKAIASGGYGCVFKPAIKCDKNKDNYQNMVSKLMTTESGQDEMDETSYLRTVLKNLEKTTIPDYKKYTIIPESTCIPKELSQEDKENLTTKCGNILGDSYKKVLNNDFTGFVSLNMDYGGVDLTHMFENINIDFVKINNSLLELLNNFITKINKAGIVHSDVKKENILINPTTFECRLIDWGMITVSHSVYNAMSWRKFMFNCPPSMILFNEDYTPDIDRTLRVYKRKTNMSKDDLIVNIARSLKNIVNENDFGDAHLAHMSFSVYSILNYTDNHRVDTQEAAKDVIFEYIAYCLDHFQYSDGEFNSSDYYKVYSHNADIWGFLTVYIDILKLTRTKIDVKYANAQDFKMEIGNLLFKHLLMDPSKKIDVKELTNDLKKLNRYFISEEPSDQNVGENLSKQMTTLSLQPSKITTKSATKSAPKSTRKSATKSATKSTRKSVTKSATKSARMFSVKSAPKSISTSGQKSSIKTKYTTKSATKSSTKPTQKTTRRKRCTK